MLSIIICSIDPARFEKISRHFESLLAPAPTPAQPPSFEIIGIHDAASMSEGYNRGLAQSRGEHLLFCHDDIEIWSPDFGPRLDALLRDHEVVGVAGTSRLVGPAWIAAGPPFIAGIVAHPAPGGLYLVQIYGTPAPVVRNIQALDGLFIACRREIAERFPWDAQTFTGFHCYDTDWSFRAAQAGVDIVVATDLAIFHHSMGAFKEGWNAAAEAFMKKHAPALSTITPRRAQIAQALVPTRNDALEILTHFRTSFNL